MSNNHNSNSNEKSRKVSRFKEILETSLEDYRNRLKEVSLVVSIMGAGFPMGSKCLEGSFVQCENCDNKNSCEAKKRKYLKQKIEENHLANTIFMEELKFIYPGIEEELYLEDLKNLELIFIFPESPGSIDEFIKFYHNPKIVPKLRVLVKPKYHPLISDKRGVVRDSLLEFLTVHGHVYPFKDLSNAKWIIIKLLKSYRIIKYKRNQKEGYKF